MTLAARQIALLDAMGIPVWQRRAGNDVIPSEVPVSLTEQVRDKCHKLSQSADYVFYHKDDDTADIHRLLQAIVFVMDWDWQPENRLTLPQMHYLIKQTKPVKPICLLFDDALTSADVIAQGATATTIALPSLSSLLEQPRLKKQAWLQLQQTMMVRHGDD